MFSMDQVGLILVSVLKKKNFQHVLSTKSAAGRYASAAEVSAHTPTRVWVRGPVQS